MFKYIQVTTVNCQLQDVKKPTPYYHSLKTKVLKTTLKTKNIEIIILPKIQCVYIKQININTVYNYLKNSSKSQKFIDSKNYGCCVSTIHTNDGVLCTCPKSLLILSSEVLNWTLSHI